MLAGCTSVQYNSGNHTARPDSVQFPNGMTTAYDFYPVSGTANDDRLAEIHTTGPGGTISKFNYQYDPNGRINQWTQQQGGASALRNYAFAYDRSGQLTDTVITDDSENILKTWSWQYDPAGNRLRESVDTSSTYNTFNNLNQLDQIGGSGTTLVQGIVDDVARERGDGAPKVCPKGCFWRVPFGRQEQQPAIASPSEASGEGWVTVNGVQAAMFALPDGDYRFRRTIPVEEGSNTITVEAMDASENVATNVYTVQIGGVLKELEFDLNGNLRYERDDNEVVLREFQWDARNRLVAIIDGDNTTEFEYDGLDRRVRIVEKENDVEQSNVTFLWAGSDIIQKRAANTETILRNYFDDGFTEGSNNYYYTKDHLGSIREVVADDGITIESRYEYTPWGVVTRTEGTGVESDFLYTGHLYHEESGLFLAQYRAYDPGTGRWLSRDPLGFVDGPNLYAYVGNDPINFWDPWGLSTWWNPFTWDSSDWSAAAYGAKTPFRLVSEALEYGECNRGVTGNDHDHHAIAVRRFGQNVEKHYGFVAGAFAAKGAGVAGNVLEIALWISPFHEAGDWLDDMKANDQGFMDYLEERIYPNERERGCK